MGSERRFLGVYQDFEILGMNFRESSWSRGTLSKKERADEFDKSAKDG